MNKAELIGRWLVVVPLAALGGASCAFTASTIGAGVGGGLAGGFVYGPDFHNVGAYRLAHYFLAFAAPLASIVCGALTVPKGSGRLTAFVVAAFWSLFATFAHRGSARVGTNEPEFTALLGPGLGWQGIASAFLSLAGAALGIWIAARIDRAGRRG